MTTVRAGVIAGVDTHADTHHAALISDTGQHVADRSFPATPAGYQALAVFITSHGPLVRVGVEGTSSYGAGLTRVLLATDMPVVEVIRPARTNRRRGKSDPIDAYAAAAAALANDKLPTPKTSADQVDAIRAVLTVRRSAVKAATATMNQIHNLLITAPNQLREQYRTLSGAKLIAALAAQTADDHHHIRTALQRLAHRHQHLTAEVTAADTDLDHLTALANPALRSGYGIGPISAAQLLVTAGDNPDRITTDAKLAALCGISPIPASSGKTNRHRLNRGGDRQANSAFHRIALIRLQHDPRTKAWAEPRQTPHNSNNKHILRCLKRALCREIHHYLLNPHDIPDITDLRPLRHTLGLTLAHAAQQLNTTTATNSRLERGQHRNDHLATTYRTWLHTHPTP